MTQNFRASATRPAPVVLGIVGLCALLELAFTLAEMPFFQFDSLRRVAIVHGAFWPGLLDGWEPVFPGQRVTMFVSYAFLHGGFLHMAFNMLLLVHLGRQSVIRLGQGGFLLAFVLCAIGGAAGYWLLNGSDSPMLGASGAVFGFFGMTIFWDIQVRRKIGMSIDQPIRMMIGLAVMNVLLWFLVSGMLAWEAHLGGFVTGAVLARIVTPTPGHRARLTPRDR